jgi:uncharacterized protein YdbL (DUF1318 family)
MIKYNRTIGFCFLAVAGLLIVSAVYAAGIKERMIARLPEINQMKAAGVIGENNRGFLEFMAGKTGDAAVVDAENSDRRKVYQAIAKQQGVSPEIVGNRRALQIVAEADPGDWLQNEAGAWYQK